MSDQVLDGRFVPGSPIYDFVEARGTFNGWNAGFILTNDLSAANPYLFSGISVVSDPIGTVEQYKFVVDDGASLGWEVPASTAGGDRSFTLTNSNQILPPVLFSDLGSNDLLSADTWVTFSVNMTNAVGIDATVFQPGYDVVYFNADFLGWWPWGFQPSQYQVTNNSPAYPDLFHHSIGSQGNTPGPDLQVQHRWTR